MNLLIARQQYFGATRCLHLRGSRFLEDAGARVSNYKLLHSGSPYFQTHCLDHLWSHTLITYSTFMAFFGWDGGGSSVVECIHKIWAVCIWKVISNAIL